MADYLGMMTDALRSMPARDQLALGTSPIPVLGDLTGGYADVMNMVDNPEERTLGNIAMAGIGLVPGIPSLSAARRTAKHMNSARKRGMTIDVGPSYMEQQAALKQAAPPPVKRSQVDYGAKAQVKQREIEAYEKMLSNKGKTIDTITPRQRKEYDRMVEMMTKYQSKVKP